MWNDDVWVVDSPLIECGRLRETAKRSELAGWAQYGYCAGHSRYFWGLAAAPGVHPGRTTVAVPLTGAKADEREPMLDIFATEPTLTADGPGQTLTFKGHLDLERHRARPPAA